MLPRSEEANYFFQRRISRRIPIRDAQLLKKTELAARHLGALRRHIDRPIDAVRAYEFGAGWDLVGPFTYWLAGIESQTLVDIAPHVRLELANHTLQRMSACRGEIGELVEAVRDIDPSPLESIGDLHARFGIRYDAPVDASRTSYADGAFDFVSTTDTLEHIPVEHLGPMLRESGRLLAEGGVMSHLVDMMDHYRYVDDSITVYNFLRFSDRWWRILNSPMEPQNRLRVDEHRAIVLGAGLSILEEEIREASADDIAWLTSRRLARRFRDGRSIADLGARSYRFTAVSQARTNG